MSWYDIVHPIVSSITFGSGCHVCSSHVCRGTTSWAASRSEGGATYVHHVSPSLPLPPHRYPPFIIPPLLSRHSHAITHVDVAIERNSVCDACGGGGGASAPLRLPAARSFCRPYAHSACCVWCICYAVVLPATRPTRVLRPHSDEHSTQCVAASPATPTPSLHPTPIHGAIPRDSAFVQISMAHRCLAVPCNGAVHQCRVKNPRPCPFPRTLALRSLHPFAVLARRRAACWVR